MILFTLTIGVMGLGEPQSEMSDQNLDDLSDGVQRASVRNVRPGPVLIVRDGVGMAYMGRPFARYLSLSIFPEPFNRLRKPDGLSRRRSCFGFF